MVVHFPVALIFIGFIAEVLSLFFKSEKCLSKTGFYLMILGTVAAIAAWVSGQLFTSHPFDSGFMKLFEKHEKGALITMIVMVIGLIFRIWLVARKKESTMLKWIAFGFYFLGFIAVSLTGFVGGKMVYDFLISK
jgi:uncharacterized membrane protein